MTNVHYKEIVKNSYYTLNFDVHKKSCRGHLRYDE